MRKQGTRRWQWPLGLAMACAAGMAQAEAEKSGPQPDLDELGPVVMYLPDCDLRMKGFVGAMDASYRESACRVMTLEITRAIAANALPVKVIVYPLDQREVLDMPAEQAHGARHRIFLTMPVIASGQHGRYVETWGNLYFVADGPEKETHVDRLMRSGTGANAADAGRQMAFGFVNGALHPHCRTRQMRPILKPWKKVWATRCEGFNVIEPKELRDAGDAMRPLPPPATGAVPAE